jgi:hypothetical protein
MADPKVDHLEAELRWRLRHFLSDNALKKAGRQFLLRKLREWRWPAVLFGGTLRDISVHGPWARLRDVDLVVGGVSGDVLLAALGPYVRRKTRFGGLNLNIDGHVFDVWSLESTWAFREFPVILKGDFADLPRSTFLTVEAIAVELNTDLGQPRRFFHHRFFESILSRVVELNFPENPFPQLSVVRSFVTAQKLGFSIGPALSRYIAYFGKRSSPEELYSVQLSHYAYPFFSVGELARLLEIVSTHNRWHPGTAVRIPSRRQLCLFRDPEGFQDQAAEWSRPPGLPADDHRRNTDWLRGARPTSRAQRDWLTAR